MLQTLEEYITEFLPGKWIEDFKKICRQRKAGDINETQYYDAVTDLVLHKMPAKSAEKITKALRSDFDMGRCSFSRHFIARLIARFYGVVMDFLMNIVKRLVKCCRRRKAERSRADGIVLVMDPRSMSLITIFAY